MKGIRRTALPLRKTIPGPPRVDGIQITIESLRGISGHCGVHNGHALLGTIR